MRYKKIIIWGHPLFSHTHSYVHEAYVKAFKFLGYETYWFHDGCYPSDFDFANCLFITEGHADSKIPINSSSCYMVMYCPSPIKYQEAGRYIDIRMAAVDFKDHIQEYSLDKSKATKLGPACYFEPKSNNNIKVKNDYVDYEMPDYDKVYISWATNLLPNEFDENSLTLPRQNVIHYCGTLSSQGVCENMSNFAPFIKDCERNGIEFIHHDPWRQALSSDRVIQLIQESALGIDIRGPQHLKQRLITCRVFKNISYGHFGLTNSEEIYNELEGYCIFRSSPESLFEWGMANQNNYALKKSGFDLVKEKHTYINRINSLISIL